MPNVSLPDILIYVNGPDSASRTSIVFRSLTLLAPDPSIERIFLKDKKKGGTFFFESKSALLLQLAHVTINLLGKRRSRFFPLLLRSATIVGGRVQKKNEVLLAAKKG